MNPAELMADLRRLQALGWPLEVTPKAGISDSPHVRFVEPQAT